jgi:hypothetical protein
MRFFGSLAVTVNVNEAILCQQLAMVESKKRPVHRGAGDYS